MNSKQLISIAGVSLFTLPAIAQKVQPNILCITCEDISPYVGCFGDNVAVTPYLDAFSKTAIRYERMYTSVGVSSPSRASLITGMYPTAIGANYMRNHTKAKAMPANITPYHVVLPTGIKCYTEYLRAAGYYCTNNNKTDYQFPSPLTAWDECGKKAHWKNHPKDKPFFAIFNLNVTHESQVWKRTKKPLTVNPKDIKLPSYYPDDSIIRHDMAVMYSNITAMDKQFKQLIDEIKINGELENTVIIWFSDNGGPLPRQKRAIYESGTLVPFMISFPDKYRAGEKDDRLVMFADIPSTILSIAGIAPPAYMQGKAFLGKYENKKERRYIYGARNRMDEQTDKQAAVRDSRFRYVYNYTPEHPNYCPNAFRLQMPMMRRMVDLLQKDSLNAAQMKWFCSPRSVEEFYDVEKDPEEMHNLIGNSKYKKEIKRLRQELSRWITEENPRWTQTELENRSYMYPNGTQPILQSPHCKKTTQGYILTSPDDGVSFAYQINGKGYSKQHWFLYHKPIQLRKGDTLTFTAVRAGMKNSPLATINAY